jgi:hypothetical protein
LARYACKNSQRIWAIIGCIALLCCSGCGAKDTVPISGTVTFDGANLPEGNIKFFTADQLPAGIGKVIDGKYSLNCKPLGKLRVEITAVRDKTGADPHSETTGSREQYLPAEYNLQSKLTANVTADGEKQFDFPLVSRKK